MPSSRLVDLWPAAGLRVKAGDLELRWIDDELLVELAELAGRGIHDEATMPFNVPWTRGSAVEIARSVLAFQWQARGQVSPEKLSLELAVLHEGTAVGIQAISGENWPVLRQVETGSWLGLEYQGKRIGTRMRALMLHFCFEGLGAECVTSAAFTDNPASNAVSLKTGYEHNGVTRVVREGIAAVQNRYVLSRERWLAVHENNQALIGAEVTIQGVEAFLAEPGTPATSADPAGRLDA